MTVTVLGSVSVGAAVPIASLSLTQLKSLLSQVQQQLGALQGQLAIRPNIPSVPALSASLGRAQNPVAISKSVAAMPGNLASIQGGLGARVASIQSLMSLAQELVTRISAATEAAGVALYTYSGAASGLGDGLTTALSSGISDGSGAGAQVQALVLATESPGSFAALAQLLKVT